MTAVVILPIAITVVVLVVVPTSLRKSGAFGMSKAKRELAGELMSTGEKGWATIIAIRPTAMVVNNIHVQCVLHFRIEPIRGGQPFDGEKKSLLSQVAVPRIGDIWPCWYDAMDHTKFAVGQPTEITPQQIQLFEFGIRHQWTRNRVTRSSNSRVTRSNNPATRSSSRAFRSDKPVTRTSRRRSGTSNNAESALVAADGAQPGPCEITDLSSQDVRIEIRPVVDEAPADAFGQTNQTMRKRALVLGVDRCGDQRLDRFGDLSGHLAYCVVEFLVASCPAAEQEQERIVIVSHPSEVCAKAEFCLILAVGRPGGGL